MATINNFTLNSRRNGFLANAPYGYSAEVPTPTVSFSELQVHFINPVSGNLKTTSNMNYGNSVSSSINLFYLDRYWEAKLRWEKMPINFLLNMWKKVLPYKTHLSLLDWTSFTMTHTCVYWYYMAIIIGMGVYKFECFLI